MGLHASLLIGLIPACTTPLPRSPVKPTASSPGRAPSFVQVVPDGTIACERSYIGIGIISSFSGYVSDVAPGSPAERAHIRIGDYFDNRDDFMPDTLPEGAEITLQMRRDDVVTLKAVRVARVCYR